MIIETCMLQWCLLSTCFAGVLLPYLWFTLSKQTDFGVSSRDVEGVSSGHGSDSLHVSKVRHSSIIVYCMIKEKEIYIHNKKW